jgi:hypothetical protein
VKDYVRRRNFNVKLKKDPTQRGRIIRINHLLIDVDPRMYTESVLWWPDGYESDHDPSELIEDDGERP